MKKFIYEHIGKHGKRETGTIEAESLKDAEQMLSEKVIISIKEPRIKSKRIKALGTAMRFRGHDKFIIEFSAKMNYMLPSNVSVLEIISILQKRYRKDKFYSALLAKISKRLELGSTLHEAVKAESKIFGEYVIGLIHVGESTGDLKGAFESINGFYIKTSQIKKKVSKTLAVPLITIVFGLIAVVLMIKFMLPKMLETFSDLTTEIPASTQKLLDFGAFVDKHFAVLTIGFVALLLLCIKLYQQPAVRFVLDRITVHIPVFGQFIISFNLALTASTLSSLVKNNIPLDDAFDLLCGMMKNHYIKDRMRNVHKDIDKGSDMSAAFSRQSIFDEEFISVITVGERSGDLNAALYNLADNYFDIVMERSDAVMSIMTVLVTVVSGLLVSYICLTMYGPIVDMTQSVMKQYQ